MAQSNYTPIQLYRTSTAAAVPTSGNLAAGELGINLTDEKLYFKNAGGTVKLLASNSGSAGSVTSVDVSGGTTGLTASGGPITGSGTITLGGTLAVANGGTGAITAGAALTALGAAASGANTDITALDQDITITATGTIATNTIGFRGLPQNSQTGAYTLVLADQGKMINTTTGGVVIPANSSVAFPIGSTVIIYNNSASNQTISITTDTMYLAGTATTGSRTLAQRGLATCVKVTATNWAISGGGVT